MAGTILASPRLSSSQPTLARAIRSIARQSPAVARATAAALELLLEGVHRSAWPEVAWTFSQLTGDGFPVEFTFASQREAVRYTTEVAGPEVAAAERLPRAERLLARLGSTSLPAEVSTLLRRLQNSAPLLYGAWIGGRHSPDGNRYKVYAEVPRAAASEANAFVRTLLGERRLLATRVPRLRLIGYEPDTSRMELYFRTEHLDMWEVTHLLRRAGLASRAAQLLGLLEAAYDRPMTTVFPRSHCGFSFSLAPAAGPTVFSLFLFARSVFGGDGSIRRRLLALATQQGWSLQHYAAFSAPLAQRSGWRTRHGMVAFIVPPEAPLALQIGLRPPESSG